MTTSGEEESPWQTLCLPSSLLRKSPNQLEVSLVQGEVKARAKARARRTRAKTKLRIRAKAFPSLTFFAGRGNWVKYPDGSWGPVNKSFVFSTSLYTNKATPNFLPAEVWADIDLVYGVRRDNSRMVFF
jgi:hypothetical protein